jgi:spore germination protein GerM
MNSKKIWVLLVVILFLAGASGGYFLFRKFALKEKLLPSASVQENVPAGAEEFTALRLYYPIDNRLELIEKKVPRRTKQMTLADAVIEEYFKGPGNGKSSQVPQNVKLLGLYRDSAQMLYLDLSDELRRNFQGDALTEFLLLKGVYESLISNLQDVQDIKILIEGKEAETLGGHLYLKFPLKNTVAYEYKGETKATDE